MTRAPIFFVASLREADWPVWQRLIAIGLPEKFEDWQATISLAAQTAAERGLKSVLIEIDPMTFIAWCVSSQIQPDMASLVRFVNLKGAAEYM